MYQLRRPLDLTLGRIRIAPVRVLCSDRTVRSVDNKLGMLIVRNNTSYLDSFRLGSRAYSSSCVALTLDLPSAVRMGRYMLIVSHLSILRIHEAETEDCFSRCC